jgi:hypothetical protein
MYGPMWIFVLGALTLGACGVWTDTNMLDSRTAVISGRGGAIHSQGEVTKSVLQEAAKQALQRGYGYFQVVSAADRSSTGAMAYATPTTYARTGPGTVTATPGAAFVSPYAMPAGDITVRFYKEPPDGPGVWNAQEVLATK